MNINETFPNSNVSIQNVNCTETRMLRLNGMKHRQDFLKTARHIELARDLE